jgi:hypothetical protein
MYTLIFLYTGTVGRSVASGVARVPRPRAGAFYEYLSILICAGEERVCKVGSCKLKLYDDRPHTDYWLRRFLIIGKRRAVRLLEREAVLCI